MISYHVTYVDDYEQDQEMMFEYREQAVEWMKTSRERITNAWRREDVDIPAEARRYP